MARKPTVGIVGAGRVGSAFAIALANAGYPIAAASSRSRSGRQRVHNRLDVPVLEPVEVASAGELVIVSVPDDALEQVAADIAPGVRKRSIVVHTSGGASVDLLNPAKAAGARIGCIHPLQTIPDAARGAEALEGAAIAITCEPSDRASLMRVARDLGGRPFSISDESKPVYHAAAVFASNYLVSSIWAAVKLLESIGIRHSAQLLGPLVEATVENVLTRGGAKAITGPVARGDAALVRKHLEALADGDPAEGTITDSYRALATMTAALVGQDHRAFKREIA